VANGSKDEVDLGGNSEPFSTSRANEFVEHRLGEEGILLIYSAGHGQLDDKDKIEECVVQRYISSVLGTITGTNHESVHKEGSAASGRRRHRL